MNLTQDSENQVIKTAKAFGSLKKVYHCSGVYDLLLEIEPNSFDGLRELIHKYRRIEDVKSILTLLKTRVVSEDNSTADEKKKSL